MQRDNINCGPYDYHAVYTSTRPGQKSFSAISGRVRKEGSGYVSAQITIIIVIIKFCVTTTTSSTALLSSWFSNDLRWGEIDGSVGRVPHSPTPLLALTYLFRNWRSTARYRSSTSSSYFENSPCIKDFKVEASSACRERWASWSVKSCQNQPISHIYRKNINQNQSRISFSQTHTLNGQVTPWFVVVRSSEMPPVRRRQLLEQIHEAVGREGGR